MRGSSGRTGRLLSKGSVRGLVTSLASNCVWKTLLNISSSGLRLASVVTAVRLLKASKPGLEVGVTAGRKVVTTGADGVVEGVLNVVVVVVNRG